MRSSVRRRVRVTFVVQDIDQFRLAELVERFIRQARAVDNIGKDHQSGGPVENGEDQDRQRDQTDAGCGEKDALPDGRRGCARQDCCAGW